MYQIMKMNTENIIVLERNGVRLSFGENPDNNDYLAYLAWLAEGNTPEVVEF